MDTKDIRLTAELEEFVVKLGFEWDNTVRRWYHELAPGEWFDFSATSPFGIVKFIYQAGVHQGIAETQYKMRQVMGIRESTAQGR
jgi:hypothetical protein